MTTKNSSILHSNIWGALYKAEHFSCDKSITGLENLPNASCYCFLFYLLFHEFYKVSESSQAAFVVDPQRFALQKMNQGSAIFFR